MCSKPSNVLALHPGLLFGNPHFSRSGWQFGSRNKWETHTPSCHLFHYRKASGNDRLQDGECKLVKYVLITEYERRKRLNEKDEGTDVKFGKKLVWNVMLHLSGEGNVIFPLRTVSALSAGTHSRLHSRLIAIPMKKLANPQGRCSSLSTLSHGHLLQVRAFPRGTHLHRLILHSWFQMACIVLNCMPFAVQPWRCRTSFTAYCLKCNLMHIMTMTMSIYMD